MRHRPPSFSHTPTHSLANSLTYNSVILSRPSFVSGVIKRERVHAFELMLWRACRGNVFLRQAEIEEPLEDPVSVSV